MIRLGVNKNLKDNLLGKILVGKPPSQRLSPLASRKISCEASSSVQKIQPGIIARRRREKS